MSPSAAADLTERTRTWTTAWWPQDVTLQAHVYTTVGVLVVVAVS